MKKLKVACLFGGKSSEYSISLVSATSVLKNIDRNKYDVIMIGITKDGNFYLYEGDIDSIENDSWFDKKYCKKISFSTNREDRGFVILDDKVQGSKIVSIDVAFPILHGRNGEDGRLQGLFELAGIKYVGCGMASSLICMDKFLAHSLVERENILVPRSFLFTKNDSYEEIESSIKSLNFPVFVKPLKAGSSFGITKVEEKQNLEKAVSDAFVYDDKIVIEENIDGFEVGCAILGDNELIVGEVDEIELADGFFDYEEKYTLKTSKIHLPARLSSKERENIKNTALRIYRTLGCKGLARVDMFYTKDGKIVFNEVNTIPGFTSHSRYPSMLKAVGYSFGDIIDKLIDMRR